MYIDPKTVDEIYNRADIVEVVSDFVSLRKAGVNYKGLCPFHNERTPSFIVSPSKGICHCFSCGKGGNVVHFLMEHEQFSYNEALRWLAKKYNIEIEERELTPEEKKAVGERESMFIVNEWANKVFQKNLHETQEGQTIALKYINYREIRDDMIEKFQLGYSLNSGHQLAELAKKEGFDEEYLIKTGLCFKNDRGELIDKYRGRIIFPVFTRSGKVVAFGGRTMSADKKIAKYINSPESEIYHKSNELYGIYQAGSAISKANRCYLVEGYMDVIAMHQCGLYNVVASSGTSLTEGQIKMIRRFTENITVLYDGDAAGIKASLRGIDMLLEAGLNIKVLLLPDRDDPDSFSHKCTPEEYQRYFEEHEEDFISFKTRMLIGEQNEERDLQKRSEMIANIVQSASLVPDAISRSLYIHECAFKLNLKEELLNKEVARVRRKRNKEREKQIEKENQEDEDSSISIQAIQNSNKNDMILKERQQIERRLIELIVLYGEQEVTCIMLADGISHSVNVIEYIAADFAQNGIQFETPIYQRIWQEALTQNQVPQFESQHYFLTNPDVEISREAASLLNEQGQLNERFAQSRRIHQTSEKLAQIVPQVVNRLKLHIVNAECADIMQQLSTIQQEANASRGQELLNRYKQLNDIKKQLSLLVNETQIRL